MPIIKSAKKRMHQTVKRRARNQSTKRSLRAEMKAFAAAVEAKDGKKAAEAIKKVQSNLDKAVKKNVLKKNTAARKLSQLSEKAKNIGAKPTSATKKKAAPAKSIAKKTPATKKPAAKKQAAKTAAKKPVSAKKA